MGRTQTISSTGFEGIFWSSVEERNHSRRVPYSVWWCVKNVAMAVQLIPLFNDNEAGLESSPPYAIEPTSPPHSLGHMDGKTFPASEANIKGNISA